MKPALSNLFSRRAFAGLFLSFAAVSVFAVQAACIGLSALPPLDGEPDTDIMESWADFSTLDGLLALGFGIAVILRRKFEEKRSKRALPAAPPRLILGVTGRA
jgi:hypothetical protein